MVSVISRLRLEKRLHRGMVRLIPVPQERDQIAIIAANGHQRAARQVPRLDGARAIVEPSKVILRVSLDVRGIRGGPVSAARRVAEHMECRATKRVAPLVDVNRTTRYVDAVLLIRLARAACHGAIACRKRQTSSMVHGASRNQRSHVEHTRVVLKSAHAVRLDTKVGLNDVTVASENLDADECREHP